MVRKTASKSSSRPRYQVTHATASLASLAACSIALGACDGCDTKPYTPYTLEAGPPVPVADAGETTSADAGLDDAAVDAGLFAPEKGVDAPGDGKSWPLDGAAVVPAPTGRTFTVGLAADLDEDGQRDLLAWARAPDGRGELWFASGARPDAGRTVAALPAELAARGCSSAATIARVGPHTAALDFALACVRPERGRPIRWIAILHTGRDAAPAAPAMAPPMPPQPDEAIPELRLELRLAAPPGDEVIVVTVDGSDRDADGRDDVSATFTLSGQRSPFAGPTAATALVRFFDRPAGMSRDPSEPEAGLGASAAQLVAAARRKATAPSVAHSARQLRRLRAALCAESGEEVLTTSAGPVRCGEAYSLEEAGYAEGVAALTLSEPGRALAAVARLEAAPAGKGRRKELEKLVAKAAPEAAAVAVHRVKAAPTGGDVTTLGTSPLAFEHAGHLLVRTEAGVVRVDRDSFAETPAPEATPWPAALAGDREELVKIVQRCDPTALLAELVPAAGGAASTVALPLLGPLDPSGAPARDGRCTPTGVRASLLDAAPNRYVLAVGGEPIAIDKRGKTPAVSLVAVPLMGERPLGAARSPDGTTAASFAPRGVLVEASRSARVWTSADLAQAWGCAPSNGGSRLACVIGTTATIFETK
jgi:hypothetical protein